MILPAAVDLSDSLCTRLVAWIAWYHYNTHAHSYTVVGHALFWCLAGRPDKHPRLQLTAALFEDTGWWIPRWKEIAPLDFGRNGGCDFYQNLGMPYIAANDNQQFYCQPEGGSKWLNASLISGRDRLAVHCVMAKRLREQ